MVHPDGLTVVNVLRSHRVPFSALKAVRVGQGVVLDTTAGRIASWGAPGAGRLGPRLGGRPGSSARVHMPARTQAAVDAAWTAWEHSADDRKHDAGAPSAANATGLVAARWDVGAGVVGLVLLAVFVVAVAT
nr:PH domain-containing protein [Arthrobacter sp. SDTb3-6]